MLPLYFSGISSVKILILGSVDPIGVDVLVTSIDVLLGSPLHVPKDALSQFGWDTRRCNRRSLYRLCMGRRTYPCNSLLHAISETDVAVFGLSRMLCTRLVLRKI